MSSQHSLQVDDESEPSISQDVAEKGPSIVTPPAASVLNDDPYEWPLSRKIIIALVISLGQLVTLMSASMMAPALPEIAVDLGMGSTETQVSFSVYILALGFAPFLLSPASEILGRKPVWVASNMFYILWNSLCPVGRSKAVLIVGRVLAGSGASAGVALSGPILADMFRKEHRGRSLALATVFPYLGPALGPIVGGIVSQKVTWPWLFYILSIVDSGVLLLGIVVIRESYGPVLLRRQLEKQATSPAPKVSFQDGLLKARSNFARPVNLLFRRPIIQIMALLLALEFGIYVLVLSTYAVLYIDQYHQSPLDASLHYIAIAIGAAIAAQGGGQLMDFIYRRLLVRYPEGRPELRLPSIALGTLVTPIGLFMFGWSAQSGISWVMVDIGTVIFTCGSFGATQACLAYIIDEFLDCTASASAAARLLSNTFGFVFPLFAPQLFAKLGYGWGTSLLAFIWIVIAVPVVVMLWLRGPQLRVLGRQTGVE